MKRILMISILSIFLLQAKAQQDPMFTHYMYNTLGVNPAYAGSRDALTATLLHRSQWVDFPGAPLTQSLTVHSPVNEGVNLGLSAQNDHVGPITSTSLSLSYAFRFNLTENSKLAFGLSAGFNHINPNFGDVDLTQPGDPAFSVLENKFLPNVGFGAYYSRERFYAGFSIPRLFENSYTVEYDYSQTNFNKERRNYVLIAGGMIPLSYDWDLKPTGLMKATEGSPMQLDLTCQLVFQNKIDFGLMYRTDMEVTQFLNTGDGIGVLVGVDLIDNFYLGYSFDYSFTNSTRYANKGSHEVMLRYDLVYKDKFRIRSPRYF